MGEVYRARDTRLDRSVAIKVLPPGMTGNAERRARFEREARTLASLSHPRICTLYDVGEHQGSTFLVMEHLQGETLADRIFRGPLPLAQALGIAVQIAEGLDAAHKRGIVHRDLKPGNVMLTKAGAILLDFGLAKLCGHGESPALTLAGDAPTESASITREGTIVGTLQYMAPEQIQGQEADARADLWALGAMLYEMVSGKRPFTGASAASLMGAILERDPPSLSTALPVSPPSLDRVLRRCLAKSPDERWESARDLADELRWIAQDVERGEPQAAVAQARPLWRRALPITAVAVAGSLAGAAVLSILRPAAAPVPRPKVLALLETKPAEAVFGQESRTPGGSRTAFDWTPDGRALVFVGRVGETQQLFERRLDASDARALSGTDNASGPVVSKDGQWVAFFAGGAIRKIPLAGGPATVVVERESAPTALDWGDSGTIVFDGGSGDGRIWKVPIGGKAEAVTTLGKGEIGHITPHLLPGGDVVLFTVRRREWSWGDEEVVAQVLASGERKVLLTNATDARYLPPGRITFLRQGVLFAVAFDPDRLEVKGAPVALLKGVAQALTSTDSSDITGAGQWTVSAAGDLAYIASPLVPFRESRLVSVGRSGQVEPLPAPARSYGPARLSLDGRRLAVSILGPTEVGISIYDLTRQTLTGLPSQGAEQFWPLWAPDGQRVVFDLMQSGIHSLGWQQADGSAPPATLAREAAIPISWSPDGSELAVFKDDGIWVVDFTSDPPKLRPVVQRPGAALWPAFSPDGRWLLWAGWTTESQVYLQPYPGPGPRVQVSVENGRSPTWNPNSREIFFTTYDAAKGWRMMSVAVALGATATLGTPRPLFGFDTSDLDIECGPGPCYSVSPDGQRFITSQSLKTDPPPPVTQIHLIQNWLAELEAKVPSGL